MRPRERPPVPWEVLEYLLIPFGFEALQDSQLGKRTIELEPFGHPFMRALMRLAGVPGSKRGDVAPASDEIEDRAIGWILKHLEAEETSPIVHQSRPVQKCLPDILLSMIEHAEA